MHSICETMARKRKVKNICMEIFRYLSIYAYGEGEGEGERERESETDTPPAMPPAARDLQMLRRACRLGALTPSLAILASSAKFTIVVTALSLLFPTTSSDVIKKNLI